MSENISIFTLLDDNLKVFFLQFIDSATKQNLFIHFNQDFKQIIINININKLLQMLDPLNNNWSISDINLHNTTLDSKSNQIIYICQNPIFENLLFELQSLTFKNNLQLYHKIEQIIYEYYFFKLSHPIINSLYISNTPETFNLISTSQLNWIINNRHDLSFVIENIPVASFYIVNKHYIIKDEAEVYHTNYPALNCLTIVNEFNKLISKYIPYFEVFLDHNLILAGGSISSIIYNYYYRPKSFINFDDIDLFYFENMNKDTLLSILVKLYKYFKKLDLHFICYQYAEDNYWLTDNNEYNLPTKRNLKPVEELYYKKYAVIFNIILINNSTYDKYNLPQHKQFFLSTEFFY